jgi:hypothetical protein
MSISDENRGFTDKKGVAEYFGVSVWQVDRWVDQGVIPRGVPMTRDGKRLWRLSDLDHAFERASRSRRPRREPRGIVRQRLERSARR